jgi:membrane protein
VPAWLGSVARTVEVVGDRTVRGFVAHRCPQLAAAIAYYAMFSIVPVLTVAVAVLGLVLRDASARESFVDAVLDRLPLSENGARDLEAAVERLARGESALGLLAVLGIVWAASGVMGSIRNAFATIFDSRAHPLLVAKLVDFGLVMLAMCALGASFGLSLVVQAGRQLGDEASELGPLASSATWTLVLLGVLAPLALTVLVFALLYRLVPRRLLPWRPVLAGAIVGGGLFELLKAGFAYYVQHVGDFDRVYGSLGAAMAFLLLVYLSAQALLVGAEVARSAAEPKPPAGPRRPLGPKLRRFLRSLVRDD